MKIKPLKLHGAYEIELNPLQDSRGYFMRTYDETIFHSYGLTTLWLQENQSLSTKKGIIRGLHFQCPPHSETKLVRALIGTVVDVFVDLRKDSETYGQWDSVILSEHSPVMVYIPKGFAHGFCTLTEEALISYKVDSCYAPDYEGGIRWNDKILNIHWPANEPYLSDKDKALPSLEDFASPF